MCLIQLPQTLDSGKVGVRVMKSMAKVVFFCGCRHHVCELVAKNCWYTLFKEDLSPDCKFFLEVKELLADVDTRQKK